MISKTNLVHANPDTALKMVKILNGNDNLLDLKLVRYMRESENRYLLIIEGDPECVIKLEAAAHVKDSLDVRYPTLEQNQKLRSYGISPAGLNRAAAAKQLSYYEKGIGMRQVEEA